MHWAVALTKQLVDVDLVCARVQKGSGPRDLAVALGSTVELIGQKIKNALSLIIHSAFPLTVCDQTHKRVDYHSLPLLVTAWELARASLCRGPGQ